ncbi:MAG: helix-turn-helix domain-containing protein [Candidatus Promineifilaceae bacterium]|nr:helix-turn-helix domain-containing protein [Candidatus Promineifilaceae bacterium]
MDLPQPSDVTLDDVVRLALPFGTVVATGPDQTSRRVEWLYTLAAWEDLPTAVQPHDLVVISPTLQEQMAADTLADHLPGLARMPIAALITFREIPEAVKQSAIKLALPILVLPEETELRYVQRVITSLLLDRQAQVTERGMELYRRLSEMSLDGLGLSAMADLMSTLTGKVIAIQDKRLDMRALSVPAHSAIAEERLRQVLGQRDNLPAILRNRKAAAKARQSHWQQLLPIENIGRLVAPIISGDRARGYVSVVGPADELDLLDSLTVEQGAVACALEMAKAKAVSDAEEALRGDFLEGLLAGTLPAKEIERLESRLDHDTKQPHVILAIAWAEEESDLTLAQMEAAIRWLLSSHDRPALVHRYAEEHAIIFQALRDSHNRGSAHELDRRLREHIQAEFDGARLVSGMSGPANELQAWPAVHQEAVKAMQLGRRLHFNHLVEFDSLGIYQMLTQIEHLPDVQEFARQIIGPLADYDRRHRGSLVETIDAYFNHHANVSQTAESLFIHRNTLLYRLDRIQELTGQDINQADMRLALHLALKLWQLRPDA